MTPTPLNIGGRFLAILDLVNPSRVGSQLIGRKTGVLKWSTPRKRHGGDADKEIAEWRLNEMGHLNVRNGYQ